LFWRIILFFRWLNLVFLFILSGLSSLLLFVFCLITLFNILTITAALAFCFFKLKVFLFLVVKIAGLLLIWLILFLLFLLFRSLYFFLLIDLFLSLSFLLIFAALLISLILACRGFQHVSLLFSICPVRRRFLAIQWWSIIVLAWKKEFYVKFILSFPIQY
jgi:hypothetical protein